MVNDVLVGLLIGGVLMGLVWPWPGGLWVILRQKKQIDFLTEKKYPETGEIEKEK